MSAAIAGSLFISLISLTCLGLFFWKAKFTFSQHKFHVFSYMVLVLFGFNLVVRALWFCVDISGISPQMAGFLMCYPSLNMVVITFTATHVWTYDFLLFQVGDRADLRMHLRREVTILTFLTGLLMGVEYFCFALSLPFDDKEYERIGGLFTFMGILMLIVLLLVCCSF
jgi:hypothetical protein